MGVCDTRPSAAPHDASLTPTRHEEYHFPNDEAENERLGGCPLRYPTTKARIGKEGLATADAS